MASELIVSDKTAVRQRRRRDRYRAGRFLWKESSLKRVRSCGKVSVVEGGGVAVRVDQGEHGPVAGVAGLASCGSVWSCPRCAGKILAHRQTELAQAFEKHCLNGGAVAMLTLTMRHDKSQSLAELWDLLSRCWRSVVSGKGWLMLKAQYGFATLETDKHGQLRAGGQLDWVRVVEVTHGKNGWHVHIHVAFLLPDTVTADRADDLGAMIFHRWKNAIEKRGYRTPTHRHGFDVSYLASGTEALLAGYFVKNSYDAVAAETMRGDLKGGKRGNRTPFQLLNAVVEDGDADALDLWHEWEQASRGRRQVGWSKGARRRLLDLPDLTDEEIAEEDCKGQDLMYLNAADWRKIVKKDLRIQLLEAVEADPTGVLIARELRRWGCQPFIL